MQNNSTDHKHYSKISYHVDTGRCHGAVIAVNYDFHDKHFLVKHKFVT